MPLRANPDYPSKSGSLHDGHPQPLDLRSQPQQGGLQEGPPGGSARLGDRDQDSVQESAEVKEEVCT